MLLPTKLQARVTALPQSSFVRQQCLHHLAESSTSSDGFSSILAEVKLLGLLDLSALDAADIQPVHAEC